MCAIGWSTVTDCLRHEDRCRTVIRSRPWPCTRIEPAIRDWPTEKNAILALFVGQTEERTYHRKQRRTRGQASREAGRRIEGAASINGYLLVSGHAVKK
jgi:hypothetical protein